MSWKYISYNILNVYVEVYCVESREDSTMYTFLLNSMVRGYHKYKSLWMNLFDGEELICKQEIGNPCNPQAVAMKKDKPRATSC